MRRLPTGAWSCYACSGSFRRLDNLEGGPVEPSSLAVLEAGEEPEFGSHPPEVLVGPQQWKLPLLLLTDRRFMVVKERLFGKPRVEFEVGWGDVGNVAGRLAPSGMFIDAADGEG